MNSVRLNNLSLKYQSFTTLGCKDIGIRKFEFGAKTQFLYKLRPKVAGNQIMQYRNKFKLLYEHQYRFRAKHNATQPLIHFLDKICQALNKPESE